MSLTKTAKVDRPPTTKSSVAPVLSMVVMDQVPKIWVLGTLGCHEGAKFYFRCYYFIILFMRDFCNVSVTIKFKIKKFILTYV